MRKSFYLSAVCVFLAFQAAYAQDAPAKAPLEHVIGAIVSIDSSNHSVVVKQDQTGTSVTVLLANTRTLLKVEPGAKDLKTATRITADDLETGDRIEARGLKPEDNPNAIAARSVILMSGRSLEKAHAEQAAAWQHSTAGVVGSVDAGAGKITMNVRSAEGPKPVQVSTVASTEFTRYSPENPKSPAPSQFAALQPGDQMRVIGNKNEDGTTITAQRVYSGAFRNVSATVSAVAADGKSITVKDLISKKPVEVAVNDTSSVRKLSPQMAMGLARRFNPSLKAEGAPDGAPPARPASPSPEGSAPANRPAGGGGGFRTGEISQMLERLPKVELSELKPGDALLISGVATGSDNSHLLATYVIAGVEPILQSAPNRQQNLGGDWGLGEIAAPQ